MPQPVCWRCLDWLQELRGYNKVALVFDDNAHVWEHWRDNLIPVPPYCYWEHEPYWVDAHLHSNAYVLDGFDEQLGGGPLVTAWDVTVDVLSSAILALPPANAAQNLDVKAALHEKREQVVSFCCSNSAILCDSGACEVSYLGHLLGMDAVY